MKKKLFGFVTAILTLGVLGGTAFIASNSEKNEIDVVQAATNTNYEYDVYVDISGTDWSEVYCHNWGGTSGTSWPGTKMTKIGDTTLYGCSLKSKDNNMVIFTNNKGAQTADLNYYPNNYFSYSSNMWKPLLSEKKIIENKYETHRVWYMPSYNDWWTKDCIQHVQWVENNITYSAPAYKAGTISTHEYYYADIGINATEFYICRVDNIGMRIYNKTNPITIDSSYKAGSVVEIWQSGGEIGKEFGTSQALKGSSVDICLLALDGILSCSDSNLNGVGSYNNYKENFFDKLSDTDKITFRNSTIDDYKYEEGFVSYENHSGELAEYKVEDKLNEISNSVSGTRSLSVFSENYTYLIIVLVLTFSSFIGFIILKKKRQTN